MFTRSIILGCPHCPHSLLKWLAFTTPVIRDSKTAKNAYLKDLFRSNNDAEDVSVHDHVLGVDMSVNIVKAVVMSPNSISQFFAEPKQPLPEIVDKVIESIQALH